MKIFWRKILAFITLALTLLLIISGGMGYFIISQEPQINNLISQNKKEIEQNTTIRKKKLKMVSMMEKLIMQEALKLLKLGVIIVQVFKTMA